MDKSQWMSVTVKWVFDCIFLVSEFFECFSSLTSFVLSAFLFFHFVLSSYIHLLYRPRFFFCCFFITFHERTVLVGSLFFPLYFAFLTSFFCSGSPLALSAASSLPSSKQWCSLLSLSRQTIENFRYLCLLPFIYLSLHVVCIHFTVTLLTLHSPFYF